VKVLCILGARRRERYLSFLAGLAMRELDPQANVN